MARHDLWIISDHQNHDKLQELSALRNSSTSHPEIAAMHIFCNFDIYVQHSQDAGPSIKQLLDGLVHLLGRKKRLPHSIVFCMGDQLLADRVLMKDLNQVYRVLADFSKRVIQMVSNWMSALPSKAKPDRLPRIYITKPLPIPERYFQSRQKYFEALVRERKLYIAELVKAVKSVHIGFINANLTHEDGEFFERITSTYPRSTEKFILNPKGLLQYWKNISQNLYNLAWDAAVSNKKQNETTNQTDNKHLGQPRSLNPAQRGNQNTVFQRLGPKHGRNNKKKKIYHKGQKARIDFH